MPVIDCSPSQYQTVSLHLANLAVEGHVVHILAHLYL